MKNISMNIRYYMAEFYGTFILTFLGVGIYYLSGDILTVGITVGIAYLIAAYTLDHISHAHFNPLVTLAAYIDQRMSVKTFGIYLVAQVSGALFGYVSLLLFNIQPFFSRPLDYAFADFGILAFVSFILVYVYLAVSEQPTKRPFLGLSVGLSYAVLTIFTINTTFGVLSPLRLFEMTEVMPMLVSTAGLMLGSLLAAGFYAQLKFNPVPLQIKEEESESQ